MKSKWNYSAMVLCVLFTGWLTAQVPVPTIWRTGELDLHAPGEMKGTETVITRNGITVFTVYKEEHTDKEVPLWKLNQGAEEYYRLSSRRWVDHRSGTARYFTGMGSKLPRLVTSAIGSLPGQENQWNLIIGDSETTESDKSVLIAELLVYDRILSPVEVVKVETFLSLKHGLSLVSENELLMLGGNGDTVWYAGLQDDYRYRIAGIVNDPEWPLYREKGKSAYDGDLIAIRSVDSLVNGTFLLWGDNGKSSELHQGPGNLTTMKRQWRLGGTNANSVIAEVQVSTNWAGDLKENEQIWMVLSPDLEANFSLEDLVFLPTSKVSNGLAKAKLKEWSEVEGGYFTFAKASEFFSALETVAENECAYFTLHWRAIGGNLPFRYQLLNEQDQVIAMSARHGAGVMSNERLPIGNYFLEVTDASGRKHRKLIEPPEQCRLEAYPSMILPSQLVLSTVLRNNPSRSGAFELDLELAKAESVELTVVDVLGRMVHREYRVPETHHEFKGVEGLSGGLYRLVLRIGSEVHSLNLVNY